MWVFDYQVSWCLLLHCRRRLHIRWNARWSRCITPHTPRLQLTILFMNRPLFGSPTTTPFSLLFPDVRFYLESSAFRFSQSGWGAPCFLQLWPHSATTLHTRTQELRIARWSDSARDKEYWLAVVFGSEDWRLFSVAVSRCKFTESKMRLFGTETISLRVEEHYLDMQRVSQ